jgi:hypothetical protein
MAGICLFSRRSIRVSNLTCHLRIAGVRFSGMGSAMNEEEAMKTIRLSKPIRIALWILLIPVGLFVMICFMGLVGLLIMWWAMSGGSPGLP